MQAINFVILEKLTIKCDNAQRIRLLVNKSMKLETKLRYVDIYLHWPSQKVQCGSIHIRQMETKEMIANSLTKVLSSAQKQDSYVGITGIEDQKDHLASIMREENAFQQLQTYSEYSEVYGFGVDAT